MKIQQVRNATLVIEYAGRKFLVDPILAEKGAQPGFEGTANSHLRNPLVELPMPIEELLQVDAVIITHTHEDHWDEAAKRMIPKNLPVFVQNEADAEAIRTDGFTDIRVLTESSEFDGIAMIKTPGQHGSDAALAVIGELMGQVCGVIFRHPDEKTLYLAGDTVWNHYVEETLAKYAPDVVIVNCGDAQVIGIGSIIMGTQDVYEVVKAVPEATIIASHMEAINHCVLSRNDLRQFADERGIADRVLVPEDGEVCEF